jgi:hypothetical protein
VLKETLWNSLDCGGNFNKTWMSVACSSGSVAAPVAMSKNQKWMFPAIK